MEIDDDNFIQDQLDRILKETPHTLEFLSNVETKQGLRLRGLLTQRILAYTTEKNPRTIEKLKSDIFKYFRWIMESDMFIKKVTYSKNFLTFKAYDFIEIGKLRAASLKEEIKLLSCKKYEKRLIYFLNEFKNLVIANFDEVFYFLLTDKNVKEI